MHDKLNNIAEVLESVAQKLPEQQEKTASIHPPTPLDPEKVAAAVRFAALHVGECYGRY